MEGLLEVAADSGIGDSGDGHCGHDRNPSDNCGHPVQGKDIALANKETLVTAGHIIMPLAKETQGVHPAGGQRAQCDFSVAERGTTESVCTKILLTASGGPFRGKKTVRSWRISRLEDALKHPNWSMGRKITIDSSTLVNKGLEVMEAKWLFDVDPGADPGGGAASEHHSFHGGI